MSSGRSLTGNWSEDIELENAKLREFLDKKEKGQLAITTIKGKMQKNKRSQALTYAEDGCVGFGDTLQLLNINTGGYISADFDSRQPEPTDATTSTVSDIPTARSSIRVTQLDAKEEQDYYGDGKLHYGQKFRIATVPSLMNGKGQMYLHSQVGNLGALSKFPGRQQVEFIKAMEWNTVWTVEAADPQAREAVYGEAVKLGDAVIIRHCNTNQLLASVKTPVRNDFGLEWELSAKTMLDHHKAEKEENQFVFEGSDDPESVVEDIVEEEIVVYEPAALEALKEKLRAQLKERGATGIRELGRSFRIIDDDRSQTLERHEFSKALNDFGLYLTPHEVDILFAAFDENNDGSLDYEEFLTQVRGEMNEFRKALVDKAYAVLDANGNGVIQLDDIQVNYNAKMHPDVQSGYKTEDEVLSEFLNNFDAKGGGIAGDGNVTQKEFEEYYEDISASVDSDEYFLLMMTNAWNMDINEGGGSAMEI